MSRLRVSFSKLRNYPNKLHTILVDGDIFVYTLGFAVEDKVEWPDGTTDITGDLTLATRLIDNRVRYFSSSIPEGISFRMIITGDAPNWRKALDDSYKGSRGRKPVDYKAIRNYMRELVSVYETTDGLEADDYLAAETSADPDGVAILSFDKDFFTVPGTFIHMSQKSSARLYRINPVQAICFLMFQALAGDPVDSYSGVSKVGESKASKMLLLCDLKGLTIRQAYLLLKRTIRARERKHKAVRSVDGGSPAAGLWCQFRNCLDLAALTWSGETPGRGIGLRRLFKYRSERFEYFLPYYDPEHTHKHTQIKL